MPKRLLLSLLCLLLFDTLFAQENIANYQINVTLDADTKTLYGEETLEWTNTSPLPVDELHFHLYLNAFKDKNSTFMKESGGKLRSDKADKEGFGNIFVTGIETGDGNSLMSTLKFIQPDDQNKDDRTVAKIALDKPLEAGHTIRLNISFKAQLPKVFARTGYGRDDFFMVGQWFPKIGVFEQNKTGDWDWNCHQFHANTEFYADFGKYDVNLTVPSDFIVGATGQKVFEIKLKDNFKSVRYKAENVHDFAWTASPHYMLFEKEYNGIQLKAYMQPEHAGQHRRYFEAVEAAIDYFEKLLGKYPHKTLSMIDPPFHSSGAGGMEYPTLITCGSYWGLGTWQRFPEIVTVHEFGHQYFQGILASNEFEQSFMDEGFNQYMEGRIMDETYGDGSQFNLLGFNVGDKGTARASYVGMEFPELSQIDKNAWEYPKGTYSVMTYTKTATVLNTLENLIGREQMDAVLKNYYQKFKFKHPKLADFEQVLNKTMGKDYSWFIDQTFRKSYSCDYAVDSVSNDDNKSEVFISNKGKLHLPTDLEVTFTDGSIQLLRWEGDEMSKVFTFDNEVQTVRLDPYRKNLLDLDLLNNTYTVEKQGDFLTKYSAKALFWFQHIVGAFLFWIG